MFIDLVGMPIEGVVVEGAVSLFAAALIFSVFSVDDTAVLVVVEFRPGLDNGAKLKLKGLIG